MEQSSLVSLNEARENRRDKKMSTTCEGCVAVHNEGHETCEIGYKIEHVLKNGCLYTSYARPLEKCPKPTRYSQLIAIQLSYK